MYLYDVNNRVSFPLDSENLVDVRPIKIPSWTNFQNEEIYQKLRPRPQKRWGFLNSFFENSNGYHARKPYLGKLVSLVTQS